MLSINDLIESTLNIENVNSNIVKNPKTFNSKFVKKLSNKEKFLMMQLSEILVDTGATVNIIGEELLLKLRKLLPTDVVILPSAKSFSYA